MKKSLILLVLTALVLTGQCWAQSTPVTVGWPTTYMRYNDKAGVGTVRGDTWHFSGYTAAGNRYGSFNDGGLSGVSCNFGIVRMAQYTYGNLNSTSVALATSSTFCDNTVGYGNESRTDADYGNGCSASSGCTNKTNGGFSIAGHYYVQVHHSAVQAGAQTLDATLIRSDDIDSATPHFCNPATIQANGGTCPSNATTLAGDRPTWSTGAGVLFPNNSKTTEMSPVLPANYQDNGSTCPTVEGQNTYVYFIGESGDTTSLYIFRVPCANLPNLNVSDWQAWNGSGWTSTLSAAASVAVLSTYSPTTGGSGCGAGYWGLDGAGVRPTVTYLPTFNRYVMVGQFYNDGCILPQFKTHLRMSQAPSLLGPWTPGIASTVSPDLYQYGTNPHGFRVAAGGITSSATTLSLDTGPVTTGAAQYNQLRDPAVPFVLQIDSEQMQVTAATVGSAAWTVTRGYNGTTAASHAAGAAVIMPYRLHPGLVSFVQGTYIGTDPNHVTMDLAFEGDEFEANSGGDKTHDVYGLYFMRLHFQAEAPPQGANLIGNSALRFTMGPVGGRGIPRKGLLRLYDFFDHNGKTLYPVMRPRDMISGATCIPGNAGGPATSSLFWGASALSLTNGAALQPRCITTDNWPITGNSAFSITWVASPNAITSNVQLIGNIGYYGTAGNGFSTGYGSSGDVYVGYDNSHLIGTPGSKCSANSYCVVTVTKTAGTTSSAGTSFYVNGVPVCGPSMSTACTVYNGTVTPNTQSAPFIFGIYGNGGTANCSVAGSNCNYQLSFTGSLAAFALWNRVLAPAEAKQTCQELARAYARPPRNITLTCN